MIEFIILIMALTGIYFLDKYIKLKFGYNKDKTEFDKEYAKLIGTEPTRLH